METGVCQRWEHGRHRWRPSGEPFDPRCFEVGPVPAADAKAFVRVHHYSRSCCSLVRRHGLYAAVSLVGVAVFASPQVDAALRPWRRGEALELGRLVLRDEVPPNGESWFVARCLALLAREGLAGVVSFADPEPRADADGEVLFPGHIGVAYQALNAVYTGRGSRKTQYLLGDGRELPNRAQSKIRGGERGVRYAVAAMVAEGAREPSPGEDLAAWLRAERARLTVARPHQGNHRYVWALTRGARRDLAREPSLSYPKFNLRSCRSDAPRGLCAGRAA